MRLYEGIFIFPAEATPDTRKNRQKTLEDLLKKYKGSVRERVEWEKRVLGHPIGRHREGHITVLDFQMEPAEVAAFRKALELQESLLKYMITVKNEKMDKKSAERLERKGTKVPTAAPAKS